MKAIDTREQEIEYTKDYDTIVDECKQLIEIIIKCVSREFELVSKYKTVTDRYGEITKCPEKDQTDMIMYEKLEYIERLWEALGDRKNLFIYYICFRELYRFTHNVSIIMKNVKMLTVKPKLSDIIVEDDDDDIC
jgi:hypothetical protein